MVTSFKIALWILGTVVGLMLISTYVVMVSHYGWMAYWSGFLDCLLYIQGFVWVTGGVTGAILLAVLFILWRERNNGMS